MVFRAIKFAVEAHEGHYRKGTNIPYVSHLMNVMKILCEHHCEEEVITAGILHDVVEDTPVTAEQVERKFGKRVVEIVAGASEPAKMAKDSSWKASWRERKQHTIHYLADEASLDKLLVSGADKLDNARSILADYQKNGDLIWSRFNAGKDDQKWYYQSLVHSFQKRAKEFGYPLSAIADEYDKTVKQIFG